MSIFSLLSTDDVKTVYDICDRYIEKFDNDAEYGELLNDPSKHEVPNYDGNEELSSSSKFTNGKDYQLKKNTETSILRTKKSRIVNFIPT
jgi:hypothetical protein